MEHQTVHLFVCQGFSDWEPSYVLPMLNDPTKGFHVRTVGVSREPVKTSGGVTILPDMTLAELEPEHSALLILPGSDEWEQRKYPEAIEKAKAFLAAGVPVAAICGATAGLALAGMLDDRPHTSNAKAVGSGTAEAAVPCPQLLNSSVSSFWSTCPSQAPLQPSGCASAPQPESSSVRSA